MRKGSCLQEITCRAAVCWGEGEPLTIEEIQVEPPQSSEVRVKMLCASLCHTDILCWKGVPLALFPRVLGHEGVGVIESIGEGVTELKEGDLIVPTFIGECQECKNCNSGKTNFCEKYPTTCRGLMPDHSSRMSVRGQRLYHLFTCSTWSEYMVVSINYVVKIDSRVAPRHASLISCGFSTGFGAPWKEVEVEKGSSVAVFGLGGVGLGVVEGARMRGASKIIGVDLNEKKREKGKIFGMTDFINPEESHKSISQAIKEMTGGVGVDYSFECTGVAPLINEALESTTPGRGVTIIIGAGHQLSITVNLVALISGRTLKGSNPNLTFTLLLKNASISMLVVATSGAGFVLGSGNTIDFAGLCWTCAGTMMIAASANSLNQVFEINNDAKMKRTRQRPLPSGIQCWCSWHNFIDIQGGITSGWFCLESVLLTLAMDAGALSFYRDCTTKNARKMFHGSLLYLPVFMSGMLFHRLTDNQDGLTEINPGRLVGLPSSKTWAEESEKDDTQNKSRRACSVGAQQTQPRPPVAYASVAPFP